MRPKTIRWAAGACIGIALAGWAYYATQPEPVEVVVRPAETGVVEETVANTRVGTVKARRRAKLAPSLGGQIARLPVHEGDRVKAGDLLLELWNEDLAAEERATQNEILSAKAQAEAVSQRVEQARRTADRLLKLEESGAVSEDDVEQAVLTQRALQAELEAARASALRSEARLSVVQAQLDRTRLRAPFAGVVAEINGELNEFVTPSPIGIVTPPAVDLIDDSSFYVQAPIDEVDAPRVRTGMDARIALDARGDRSYPGTVRRVADYVLDLEKQARTVFVEVEFARPDDRLLAGYSADVEIILARRPDALRIPTEAVLGGDQVLVFLPDAGRLERRTIRTGLSNWDFTEVTEGVNLGDLIVVNVDRPGVEDQAVAVRAELADD